MLSWLQGIFESVSGFFEMIGNLISDIVSKLLDFFAYIGAAFDFLKVSISFLPGIYVTFAVIIITVLIIYLILGRNTGGD